MPRPKHNLTRNEIARVFDGDLAEKFPPILSPALLAELMTVGVKTIYFWIAEGRLDGAFRKRGKHCLIWRDRAIDLLFNGPEWEHKTKCTKKTATSSATECASTPAA
jgi:hypothetical protein